MKLRFLSILFLFFLSLATHSQDREGEVKDAEFIIEKEKAIRLPVANRIFSSFRLSDRRESIPVDLTLEEPKMEVPMFSPTIRDSFREKKVVKETYNHYIRGAFGNLVSPLLEYSFRDESEIDYGVYLFHESFGRGPVRDENSAFSESTLQLWGNLERKESILDATIEYKRNGFFFYGISDSLFSAEGADSIYFLDRAARNNLSVRFGIEGSSQNKRFRYTVSPLWNYTDLVGFSVFARENFVDFQSGLTYEVGDELSIFTNVSGALSGTTSDTSQTRTWINFNPGLLIKKQYLLIKLGIILNNQTDDIFKDNLLVAPDLRATYRLSRGSHAFVSINGGIVKNTLNELSEQMLWLSDSIRWTSSLNRIHVLAGWNGFLIDNLRAEGKVSFLQTDNQALLLNNSSDPSRFDLVYDSAMTTFSLNVKADYQTEVGLKITTDHKVNIYNTSSQEEAWHLPVYVGETGFSQTFGPLEAGATVFMLGGIKSYAPENQEVVKLSSIFDFGIDISYSINPKGKVFLSLKNMLNQDNERYLNYPAIPFSFRIGGSYNF